MIDRVVMVPLAPALREHFGASISVDANDDAIDGRCHELTAFHYARTRSRPNQLRELSP